MSAYSCVPPTAVVEAEMVIPLRRGGACHGLLADRGTSLAVVVCHPWGPLGGSLWDVVVEEVVELFGAQAGLTTLRFNFRSGVGSGASSAEDVRGACALLLGLRTPPSRLLLVGYSYGSLVVASVADDIPEVVALALISPPLYWAWALFMCNQRSLLARARQSGAAKLLLLGEKDNFCSVSQFQRFADSLQGPTQAVVLRGADHFNVFRCVSSSPARSRAPCAGRHASRRDVLPVSRPIPALTSPCLLPPCRAALPPFPLEQLRARAPRTLGMRHVRRAPRAAPGQLERRARLARRQRGGPAGRRAVQLPAAQSHGQRVRARRERRH
jgi:hypothetical protein